MFKVSLLPASYRKYMQGKALKDIFSRIALLVMVCLLIIYGGFQIKNILVKQQLKKVSQANSELVAQFPALEQYQMVYNNLKANETILNAIKPQGVSSAEFVAKVTNLMPSYVHVTEMSLSDWFTSGVCTMKCVASSFEDVVDCKALFEKQDFISSAVTTEIVKQYNTDNTVSVSFTLALSNTGVLASDGTAQVVEQTTAATTAAGDTTEETKKDDNKDNDKTTTAAETTTAKEG